MDSGSGSGRGGPMNMAVAHQNQNDHPPQYMSLSPPPVSHPGLYIPPPPSHLSVPHQGGAAYPPTSAVGVQEILNLAAASSREHPAFPGLPNPHHLQAVQVAQQQAAQVAQQQAAHQAVAAAAQVVAQHVHHQQHQPMELDLRGQSHGINQQQQQQQQVLQRLNSTPSLPIHHHQQQQQQMQHQMQQHVVPQQHQVSVPKLINIKTELSHEMGGQAEESVASGWNAQVAQQVAQISSHPATSQLGVVAVPLVASPVATGPTPQSQTTSAQSEFDVLQLKIQAMDSISVWNLVRMKILPFLTPWDFLCDRTRLCGSKFGQEDEYEGGGGNLPTSVAKLKFLLQEMNDLAEELAHLVDNCCETVEEEVEVQEEPSKGGDNHDESGGKGSRVEEERRANGQLPSNGEETETLNVDASADDSSTGETVDESEEKLEHSTEQHKVPVPPATNPNVVAVVDKVRRLLGNKVLKIKPKQLNQMAIQYQGLFDEYDGPPTNVKLESESLEVECNPFGFNNATKRRKLKKKDKEKRLRGPPYKCSVCTKAFPNRNRYNYHQKKSGACPGIPVDPKPHKYVGNRYYCIHKDCLPDGTEINADIHPQYTNRTQYWKHFAEAHGATVDHTYTCNYCAEVFPLKEMHDYHIKSKHERSHACGYCGNRFSERRTLVKHERCHTGEKPYACDSCDFRCSSSSSLCQHKRRRHDPAETGRKHICEQCGKGFYTRDNLKEHIATHSNTKMFSCYICGKGLKNDSCYRRHMVCVHGLKHTCDLCGKDFSSPVGLKHHQRGAHGILF